MLSTAVLLGIFTVNAVLGCSPPAGWEPKEPLERLKEADLVVIGKISSVENVTRGNAKFHLLSVEVDCILRNENNVSLSSELIVTEDATGAMCINSMVSVKYDVPLTMSLRYDNHDNEEEFWFDTINVQGAIYDKEEVDPKELVMYCEFVSSKERMLPSGSSGSGKCPAVSEKCTSGVMSTFVVPYLLMFSSFLYAILNV